MTTTVNTPTKSGQADFQRRAKKRMIDLDLTVAGLAQDLGLSRTTVSMAINRGLYEPSRQRIAARLGIPL